MEESTSENPEYVPGEQVPGELPRELEKALWKNLADSVSADSESVLSRSSLGMVPVLGDQDRTSENAEGLTDDGS